MFEESKIDTKTDFIPKKDGKIKTTMDLCVDYCRNAEHCPIHYVCPTAKRWLNADMDYDNSL